MCQCGKPDRENVTHRATVCRDLEGRPIACADAQAAGECDQVKECRDCSAYVTWSGSGQWGRA